MEYFGLFNVILAFLIIVLTYTFYSFTYWKRRNVPYLQPKSLFGHLPNPLLRKSEALVSVMHKLYNEIKIKNGWKYCGVYFFTQPVFFVTDLDYLKLILTKDFQYFTERGIYYNEKDDPISAHLLALGGEKWRRLRTKLTPTFTSGKMKQMFQTLVDCKSGLLQQIDKNVKNNESIDIKEISGRFTTDIIGSCAFGLDCNSSNDKDSPFRYYGKKMFQLTKLRTILTHFSSNFPNLAHSLHLRVFPADIRNFFKKIIKDTVEYRESNHVKRNDFLQLLITMKNNEQDPLTLDQMTAQSVIFFLAGFETSSTTTTFVMYELAKNQEIQTKLREEINEVLKKHNNQITYDAINELKYMNQVIDETLRKYPPVTLITRLCTKDYQLPDTDIVIEKGTKIFIPIYGIHHDPEYYPEPEKFDPERFNETNRQNLPQYAHIPFGEGPRICIGMRFGLMQTKVGLTALLKDYKFTVNQKTKNPLTISKKSIVLAAEGDIWLNAEKI